MGSRTNPWVERPVMVRDGKLCQHKVHESRMCPPQEESFGCQLGFLESQMLQIRARSVQCSASYSVITYISVGRVKCVQPGNPRNTRWQRSFMGLQCFARPVSKAAMKGHSILSFWPLGFTLPRPPARGAAVGMETASACCQGPRWGGPAWEPGQGWDQEGPHSATLEKGASWVCP